MKKILTLTVSLCFLQYANAQNPNSNANAQWRINGNSASTTDFIGTTNNQSLILKTNNVERVLFDTQGRTIFDGGSEVIIHPGGLNRPILSNPIAQYMLKVGGSGHFDGELNSRQLFVQEYITFMKSLKGPRIDVDSIKMDSTRGIFGHTKIFGDVQIKQDLEVVGNTTLKGDLTIEKGFTFDGVNGISYINNGTSQIIRYGNRVKSPSSFPCAAGPLSTTFTQQFGGALQIFDNNNPTTSGLLNLQTWTGGSSIDASVGGQTGQGGLLLNYFCGNNTFINTGWDLNPATYKNGGRVYMGAEVEMQHSLKIGYSGIPSVVDLNTSLEINQNTNNANGVKVKTWNNSIKAYSVEYLDGTNGFSVYGDGRTEIRTDVVDAFTVRNKTSNDINFKVKNSGLVYARELNVMIGTFPDYVFNKDYKLTSLEEVEKYIINNKHLKGFEKGKCYEENGMNLGEVVKLQQEKIEELTLYLIELKKEINNLKNAK